MAMAVMIRHILFLRWLLIVSLIGTGSWFAWSFGVFTEIYDKDITRLSFAIAAGFVFMSAWCGVKTFSMSTLLDRERAGPDTLNEEDLENLDKITDLEEIGWFAAGFFTSLGMIGTVIGMIWALKGFIGVNITDVASVQKLISNMVYGVSTALYTTLVGLVCSSLLKLQYFNLGHTRRRVEP
jgi:hypothetical protein